MSAMLGSSRRYGRPRVHQEIDEIVLVDNPAGPLRSWMLRLLTRLEVLFSSPESRL
jgi:hypothetical protein